MYNPSLDIFITVVEQGSFSKASEVLFLSSTAVMKHMNRLEDVIGVSLFIRSSHGIRLTEEGKLIYEEAKKMINHSNHVIEKLQSKNPVIRIGTSTMYPCQTFLDFWYHEDSVKDIFKIRTISFDSNQKNMFSTLQHLGEKFDIIISACDSKKWLGVCNFLPLGYYHFACAVPRTHSLAVKSFLTLDDLEGSTLMMMKSGDSVQNSTIRMEIESNHPSIRVEDAPYFYDLDTFNHAIQEDNILLTLDCWKDVNPGFITIPLQVEQKVPYGILYSKEPSSSVLKFIQLFENF